MFGYCQHYLQPAYVFPHYTLDNEANNLFTNIQQLSQTVVQFYQKLYETHNKQNISLFINSNMPAPPITNHAAIHVPCG